MHIMFTTAAFFIFNIIHWILLFHPFKSTITCVRVCAERVVFRDTSVNTRSRIIVSVLETVVLSVINIYFSLEKSADFYYNALNRQNVELCFELGFFFLRAPKLRVELGIEKKKLFSVYG